MDSQGSAGSRLRLPLGQHPHSLFLSVLFYLVGLPLSSRLIAKRSASGSGATCRQGSAIGHKVVDPV